jgi:hypothetical protein
MAGLSSDDASLAEMIAYVMNKHRSGCLTVRRHEDGAIKDAALYFDGGHLVDARLGDEVGDDIVYRMLGVKERLEFGWQAGLDAPGRSISRPDEYFLMATLGIDAAGLAARGSTGSRRAATALHETAEVVPREMQTSTPPALSQPSPNEQLAAHPDLVDSAHLHFRRRDTLPMPAGRPISLNEALGNSPRQLLSLDHEADLGVLLDGLSRGGFSGYLGWERKGSRGTLMFYRGQIIDALWTEVASRFGIANVGSDEAAANNASSGAAYRQIVADADQQDIRSCASLYVLDDEFIYSYASLAYGENLLGSRSSGDLSLANLLTSLARTHHSGCIRLTLEQRGDTPNAPPGPVSAYIFFSEGRELGRYREQDGVLQPDPTAPTMLAHNQHTLLDIYTSPPRAAFDILTVPADAPDPGERLDQRDLRLSSGVYPTTIPPHANTTTRHAVDQMRAAPTPRRRTAPLTRQIDIGAALRQPPAAEPTPIPSPVVAQVSNSGRLITASGRLSPGPQTPRDLAVSLQAVAHKVLGSKAGRVVDILQEIERRPQELTAIITQAKRATKMLIGIVEYEELSDEFDALLGAYKLNQSP